MKDGNYLLFDSMGFTFGVKTSSVKAVLNPTKLTTLPNSKDFVLGLMNLRGEAVLIYDLARMLKIGSIIDLQSAKTILIEGGEAGDFAIAVETVKKVFSPQKFKKGVLPAGILSSNLIKGVIETTKESIVLLDNLEKGKGLENLHSLNLFHVFQPFIFSTGHQARNLREFLHQLEIIPNEDFDYHFNEKTNHFSPWLKNILNEEKLANSIKIATDRQQIIIKIQRRLCTKMC